MNTPSFLHAGDGAAGNRIARWRSNVEFLVAYWIFTVVFVAGGASLVVSTTSWATGIGVLALFLGEAAFFAFLNTAHIDLYPDKVVIAGWLRPRHEIPLGRLLAVEPHRSGLFFRTGQFDGLSGPGLIGPKGDLLNLLRIRNRGDRIAAVIMRAAEATRSSAATGD